MSSKEFMVLYIGTFIFMAIIMILPIVLIVCLIIYLKKKSYRENREMVQKISERQKEKERLIQEEINFKKMKYKRTKCPYCDTLNPIDKAICDSCGGTLEKYD